MSPRVTISSLAEIRTYLDGAEPDTSIELNAATVTALVDLTVLAHGRLMCDEVFFCRDCGATTIHDPSCKWEPLRLALAVWSDE